MYRIAGPDAPKPPGYLRDAHGVSLPGVIHLAREMTGFPESMVIYGVEPQNLYLGNGLSPVVKKVLPRVIERVTGEIINISESYRTLEI